MARPSKELKEKKRNLRERFDLIANHLNGMEIELSIPKEEREVDLKKISLLYGKLAVLFTDVAAELEVYVE